MPEVRLLGEVTVVGPRATVGRADFGGRRPMLAFAALVLARGTPLDRDLLAEALWPDERMPVTWNAALRSVLSRLRSVLGLAGFGPDVLRSVGSAVVLLLGADVAIDVELATSLLASARAALAAGAAASASIDATEAAALLAAPLLAGLPSSWADARRANLEDLRVQALEVGAAADLAGGHPHRALASAAEAVQLAPLRESATRLLMSAQRATGNPADGLRSYEQLRERLVAEFGLRPSAETEQLRAELVADLDEVVPLRPAAATTEPAPGRIAAQANGSGASAAGLRTRRRYPLVGRDGQLGTLRRWWEGVAEGDSGVVLLTGEQGSGKTRLAAELAEQADPAVVVYGRCSPLPAPAGEPFGDAVWRWGRWVAGADGPGPPPDQAAAPPAHTAPEEVARWLGTLGEAGAVLVVLDDVHWAGPATLDAIVTCGRLVTRRVGLVLARREPPVERSGGLHGMLTALATVQPVQHVALTPLGVEDVRRLVALDGGSDEGPDGPHARALTEASGGNAFLLTELLAHLALVGDRSAWPPPARVAASVPGTVTDAVLARLDLLDPQDIAVLGHAVALGTPIDAVRVADAAGFVAAYQALAAGVRAGLLAPLGSGRFGVVHGLVRDALVARVGVLPDAGTPALWSQAAAQAWQLEPAQADELARRWWPTTR